MTKSNELRLLAERLFMISNGEEVNLGDKDTDAMRIENDDAYDDAILAKMAGSIYKIRQSRARVMPFDIFGEPAWDMLLDLFIQRSRGRRVSMTSLCIASGVPSTTALRWISLLIEFGLAERIDSNEDRRKAYVVLSESGVQKMRSALIEANRHFALRNTPFMFGQNRTTL